MPAKTHSLPDYDKRRDTARAIIVNNGHMLLIDRVRPGMRYYSTPGGGIELSESSEEAVVREVFEETSLEVVLDREVLIWKQGQHEHHFFICRYISGTPKLHKSANENYDDPGYSHSPKWVKIEKITAGSFGYWEPIRKNILDGIKHGFPGEVVYLTN